MLIFAHRGGKAHGPENTIATMKRSIDMGAQGIELDVQCSVNNEPVVIHDATVDRTTGVSGEVSKMTLEYLTSLDAGDGEPIPTLTKTLDFFAGSKAVFLVELKHPKSAMPTADIINHFITKRGYHANQLIVVTFMHQLLVQIHEKFPKLTTGASLKSIPEGGAACVSYTHSAFVLPPIDEVNSAFVSDATKRGAKVIGWVCDEDEQIRKAKKLGLYGAICSDPARALSVNG